VTRTSGADRSTQMSEISRAMEKARREQGDEGGLLSDTGGIVSPARPGRLTHYEAEQYLSLASEIGLALPGRNTRVIMFASAVPEEGTSTVARDFARTTAERSESPTLLVDANLRHPGVNEYFRVRRDPGLTDYVIGGAALEDCIVRTGVPRLSVITCGRPVIAPPRVAGDPRIAGLFEEVRDRFGFVVLDAPPLLSYSDSVQISAACDGVVLVVRAGHTRRQLHVRALDLLEEAGATTLGTVLNRRRFYIPKFVYDRI
jgi:capsular exopolysaccharide synthesis family protein